MPNDDRYRRAVQGRVEEILSNRHEKSTPQLALEALVEGMKLYRSYKEEERDERKRQGKGEDQEHRRHRKAGLMDGNGRDDNQRHHDRTHRERTDGPKNERQPRHRSRSSDRDRGRYRDGSRHRHRSRENDHPTSGASGYQASWEDLTSLPHAQSGKRQGRDASDLRRAAPALGRLAKGHQESGLESSSGPESKSPSTPRPVHRRGEKGPASRHQPWAHQRHADTQAGRADASRSPTQRHSGPDGTPFGSLPKYKPKAGMVLGLGNHLVSTYKHIKAEHDAGYRSKGFVEKALDQARKKRPNAKTGRKQRGGDGEGHAVSKGLLHRHQRVERDPGRARGDGQRASSAVETEAWEHYPREQKRRRRTGDENVQRSRGSRGRGNTSPPVPVIRVRSPTPVSSLEQESPPVSREESLSGDSRSPPRAARQQHRLEREHEANDNAEDRHKDRRRHGSGSLWNQDAAGLCMDKPRSPAEPKPPSRTASPAMSRASPTPPPHGARETGQSIPERRAGQRAGPADEACQGHQEPVDHL